MKNKEYFKRWSMEFPLKPWSGDQNFYINLKKGSKNSIKYTRMSSTPSQHVINDPSLIAAFHSMLSRGPRYIMQISSQFTSKPQPVAGPGVLPLGKYHSRFF